MMNKNEHSTYNSSHRTKDQSIDTHKLKIEDKSSSDGQLWITKRDAKTHDHQKRLIRWTMYLGLQLQIKVRRSYTDRKILILKDQADGQIMLLSMSLGWFSMFIDIFNVSGTAPNVEQINGANGKFGQLLSGKGFQGLKDVKRIYIKGKQNKDYIPNMFNPQQREKYQIWLERSLEQVFIFKPMSLFGLGPAFIEANRFDVATYENSVKFYSELCDAIKMQNEQSFLDLQYDLRRSLKIMLSLHLIHEDIKPDNIMYSKTRKKYVFIDFGLSKIIRGGYDGLYQLLQLDGFETGGQLLVIGAFIKLMDHGR